MKPYIAQKNQIEGFRDVSATVKTVEKIAAASTHFFKLEIANLHMYTTEIEKILQRLSLFHHKKENYFLQTRNHGKKMIVVLAGNKGLVGGLWHKVVAQFMEHYSKYQSFVIVGTKGKNYIEEEQISITKWFKGPSEMPQLEEVENISQYIFDEFKKEKVSKVDVLYPHFVSLAEQQSEIVSFLPFRFQLEKEDATSEGIPIFEPSKKGVFDDLLKKYISVFFHKIIMETKLSEFSARTIAMEHASVKTDEFIKKLTLDHLKVMRWISTQKQLESFTAHKTL